ncbi:Morn repeat domain containing protein [Pandoravirus salinus]|uniref:Morn repeat domain containing protein n=1 Tax=Pandoravirus salinus TaxID=1349410 RepID=S4VXL5_9VIRU|nr:morn repeat domain [Pandoravirus salinus]AGO84201.1 Morn repeat domain containing protein [Pandoravirus salinus]
MDPQESAPAPESPEPRHAGGGGSDGTAALPDEILLLVFGHLPPVDLGAASCVCALWSRVAADDSLWRRPCARAGWDPNVRPACGWRTAARRTAVGSVLALYTSVAPGRPALTHVTAVAFVARRTLSQAVASVCAVVDRRGPIRLGSFWVPSARHGSAAAEVASWVHLGAARCDLPLAALDAVAWEAPSRGILRLSDSPLVRALRVRPMVWLIGCDADRGTHVKGHDDSGNGSTKPVHGERRFVHVVDQHEGRNGAWTNAGSGTLLWRRQPYDGHWQSGRREGAGTQFYLDGGRYEGQWRGGARHGAGRYDEVAGGGYEGQWRRDRPQGRGRCWWPNGEVHDGAFAGGQPHGPGTFIARNGMRASGTWRAGVPANVHWVSPFGSVAWPTPFGVLA